MPWKVEKTDRCPAEKPYGVITEGTNKLHGCHATAARARAQQAALYANAKPGELSAEEWEQAMDEVLAAEEWPR